MRMHGVKSDVCVRPSVCRSHRLSEWTRLNVFTYVISVKRQSRGQKHEVYALNKLTFRIPAQKGQGAFSLFRWTIGSYSMLVIIYA